VASCGVAQTHRRNLLPLSPAGSPETLVATAQRRIADDASLIMNLHLTVGSSEMWVATAQRHNAEHSTLITNPVSTQLLRRKLLCSTASLLGGAALNGN
jgi:hypothetical protein